MKSEEPDTPADRERATSSPGRGAVRWGLRPSVADDIRTSYKGALRSDHRTALLAQAKYP